jgi:ABC-type Mn2+/Zn2+ transport system ATPase subunit
LLSTHDLNLAFQRFDRVLALRQIIHADGPPDEVCRREVLNALYGGRLTLLDSGMTLVVDEHGC